MTHATCMQSSCDFSMTKHHLEELLQMSNMDWFVDIKWRISNILRHSLHIDGWVLESSSRNGNWSGSVHATTTYGIASTLGKMVTFQTLHTFSSRNCRAFLIWTAYAMDDMQKVCSFTSLCTFTTPLWPIFCAYTNLWYPAKGVK